MLTKKLLFSTLALLQLTAYAITEDSSSSVATRDNVVVNICPTSKKKRDVSLLSMIWNFHIKIPVGTLMAVG